MLAKPRVHDNIPINLHLGWCKCLIQVKLGSYQGCGCRSSWFFMTFRKRRAEPVTRQMTDGGHHGARGRDDIVNKDYRSSMSMISGFVAAYSSA